MSDYKIRLLLTLAYLLLFILLNLELFTFYSTFFSVSSNTFILKTHQGHILSTYATMNLINNNFPPEEKQNPNNTLHTRLSFDRSI